MYKNKYHSDTEDKVEEPKEPATPKEEPKPSDTAKTEEPVATPTESAPKVDPVTPEEITYKKRYGDLKTHYDRTVTALRQDVKKLTSQLHEATSKQLPLPKTPEEIEAWRKEFPDVYDMIVSISRLNADERAKTVETRVNEVEQREAQVRAQQARLVLRELHPDFEQLSASQEFHDWAGKQPAEIQGWLYNNPDNPYLCARAIDLFKADRGKRTPAEPKFDKKKAAEVVAPTASSQEPVKATKKTWKISEIQRMSPAEFEKYESEIDEAQREGRISND